MRTSEWIRRDRDSGWWIPYRKRTYLYWFKFLQEAEKFDEVKVDWRKYRGWGGANVILGQKFDDWWNDRWKDLFGSEEKSGDPSKIKFPLTTTRPKTDGIRMSLLVWQLRDTPPDWRPRYHTGGKDTGTRLIKRRGSNALAIGWKLNQIETRSTYGKLQIKGGEEEEKPFGPAMYSGTDDSIRQLVSRYKRRARKTIDNVCEGRFP